MMSREPLAGNMRMPRSAYSQICWPQMPAALITSWHSTSNASPVRVLMALTPCTLSWVRSSPSTLLWVKMRAPCSLASSTLAAARRKGSTVPSGTWTAPIMAGLALGSSCSASRGSSWRVSMPAREQASMKVFWKPMSSSGRVRNRPPVSSTQWLAIRLRMRFSWMHSRADSWSVTA